MAVPKNLMRKNKSIEDEQTLAKLDSAHRHSQRLGVIVCFIGVSGVPRFQSFLNSEVSLINFSGIVEVNRVIITFQSPSSKKLWNLGTLLTLMKQTITPSRCQNNA